MGSHTVSIKVYADVGLEVEGLRKQVSIDDNWSSTDEAIIPYKTLVKDEIGYNLKPDGTMDEETWHKMMAIADALCEAGYHMKKKLRPIKLSD